MLGHINAIGLEVEGPFKEPVPIEGYVKEFKEEILPPVPALEGTTYYNRECVSGLLKNELAIESFFAAIQGRLIEKGIIPGMGFHVHMSFKNPRYYQLLYSKKFIERCKEDLFKAFKDDKALHARPVYRSPHGTNFYRMDYPDEYFLHNIPKKPHSNQREERYYFINFQRAFGDHETFEFRIFPTATVKRMKEYVQWVINYVNGYIEKYLGEEEIELEFEIDCSTTSQSIQVKKEGACVEGSVELNSSETTTNKPDWRFD